MATVTEKLYPPTIASSIPAFYDEEGTAQIVVPFSMNRAVSIDNVGGFSLKIKTAQSNNYIETLSVTGGEDVVKNILAAGIVTFTWPKVVKVVIGQFLKVQLAYIDISGNVGYFSTVATVKYTTKPNVQILGMDNEHTPVFQQTYTGVYKIPENGDKSERPYSYCFSLYDSKLQLVESSGWKLHNATLNTIASETLQLEQTIDTYTFQTSLRRNVTYYIDYKVRTINDLEISTNPYPVMEAVVLTSDKMISLIADNNFEEGYVGLSLFVDYTKYYSRALEDKILQYFNAVSVEYVDRDDRYEVRDSNNNIITTLMGIDNYITRSHSISIIVERAEVGYHASTDTFDEDFYDWKPLKKVHFKNYTDVLNWTFKDQTVEQGIFYRYAFKQYNSNQVFSNRVLSNIVEADFEDMFLWDGKRQLKIRFNPKVSSFKITRQEQKIDTIGNKFPYFFRNGVVNYREFPIGGLISYLVDNNEMFIHHDEDLNILLPQYSEREGTPSHQDTYKRVATLNSVGYNMQAERRFKMKLLEWLGDGQVKLFRSPAEGSFLVRLMNVSLTPEDRVGRLIHSFQASAFEVAELTYENLVQFGFFLLEQEEVENTLFETLSIWKQIQANGTSGGKLNNYPMINIIKIYGVTHPFYVRIGSPTEGNRFYITQTGLTLENIDLSDIYFYPGDNATNLGQSGTSLEQIHQDVGDALLYYEYSSTEIPTGDITQDDLVVDEAYIETESLSVPGSILDNWKVIENTETDDETNPTYIKEVLNYTSIKCHSKEIHDIYKQGDFYYENSNYTSEINSFKTIEVLYRIHEEGQPTEIVQFFDSNGQSRRFLNQELNYVVRLKNGDEVQSINLEHSGQLYVNPTNVTSIEIGNAAYVDYWRQVRVITFKQED